MTLQQKIDALPPWSDELSLGGSEEDRNYVDIHAALARLALAREWVLTSVPHLEGCPWRGLTRDAQGLLPGCSCGRDAMLAAMEVPNE